GDEEHRISDWRSAAAAERARKRAAASGGSAGGWSTAAIRDAAVGFSVTRTLRRVLAGTRQSLLGGHLGGNRVSAAARGIAAQGLVPHDRHLPRRGDECRDRRRLLAGSR